MKILLTGGAGFIGSAVARISIAKGNSIVNVDALTYASCFKNVAKFIGNPNYVFEQVDIRDLDVLDHVFNKHRPDSVMHLAAETHVDRSINRPIEFIDTNVRGTFNMLEAARGYWIANGSQKNFRFHHISTDEVFGSLPVDKNRYFNEDSPYDPRSPYSASKASSDHLVRAWNKTYGLPVILTNCSNNYGPFQFPEKLIPVVILNALAGKFIPIYGNGHNIRDWLYVDDHAHALILALEKGQVGRSYNIGAHNEISNLELVQKICSILDRLKPRAEGKYSELIKFIDDRPGHDIRYAVDPSRIRNELGWCPSVTFEEGLENTVQWYLDNQDWWQPLLDSNDSEERLINTT